MTSFYLANEPTGSLRPEPAGGDRLPSLSGLSNTERSLVRLDQIHGSTVYFQKYFQSAGVDPLPQTTGVEELVNRGAGPAEIKDSADKLHRALLRALSAANPRLAKAYRLGVSLATTCLLPHDKQSFEKEFNRYRLANFTEWMADLASLFPPHASQAVRLSLTAWRRWIENPRIDAVEQGSHARHWVGLNRAGGARAEEPCFDWADKATPAVRALRRQGEIWRALLSGEKHGDAMLDLGDYITAAVQTLGRTTKLLRGVRLLIGIALVAFVVGAVLLFTSGGAGKMIVGAAAVVGSLGFTWKGTLAAVGRVAGGLEHPVWGAELDVVIAKAITERPPEAIFEWREPKDFAPASGPPAELHTVGAESLKSPSGASA
ncbi:MAG TPA: hypothetical protein VF245_00765 [Solirubrobacterales bacterium]